jgi:hypothetical protein
MNQGIHRVGQEEDPLCSATAAAEATEPCPTPPDLSDRGAITTRVEYVYRVHLDRPHLDLVTRAAVDRFRRPQTTFRSERNGTLFTSSSLAELIDNINNSVASGDPERLDDLYIECRDEERSVLLAIRTDKATITVADLDPAWANGKAEQLRTLLLRAGGARRPLVWGRTLCGITGVALGIAVSTTILALTAGRPEVSAMVFVAASPFLAGVAGFLTGYRRVRHAQVHLFVAGPEPRVSLWVRMNMIERMFLISTLIALIGWITEVLRS